jgi:hypothetical protein
LGQLKGLVVCFKSILFHTVLKATGVIYGPDEVDKGQLMSHKFLDRLSFGIEQFANQRNAAGFVAMGQKSQNK